MPHDSQRRRKRPTGSPPPAVQGPIGGWRVVDRTQEAIEKGVAYILSGQHLGREPGDIYEIEDGTDAVIITGTPGPGRAKKPGRKASPQGDADDQEGG